MALKRRSFKQVLIEAICRSLHSHSSVALPVSYKTPTFQSGYQAGIDRQRLQQLADDFEMDAFLSLRGNDKKCSFRLPTSSFTPTTKQVRLMPPRYNDGKDY